MKYATAFNSIADPFLYIFLHFDHLITSPARHWHLDLTEAEPLQLKCAGHSEVEGMEGCWAQDLVEAVADSFE